MNHGFVRATLGAMLLSTVAFATPRAQVVVNGGPPNGGAGWNIFDDNRAAAVFSTGAVSFDDIRFWGILPDVPAYTPAIYWEILNDAGGSPGSIALSGNALATEVYRTSIIPGLSSWQFDVGTGTQSLGAGVYWLALHDGPLDPAGFTGSSLLWETTDVGQYAIQTFTVDNSWSVIDGSGLAFELRGTPAVVGTPEPATLGLTALGLAAAFAVRRRTRKTTTQDRV